MVRSDVRVPSFGFIAVSEFFASGRVADVVLVLIGVEALILVGFSHFTGRPAIAREAMPMLASGFFLALAFRFALRDEHWMYMALALVFALAAHIFDLLPRLRS